MTQHKESVEEVRERLAFEKADRTQNFYYYQCGAGEHYRITGYESGRRVLETLDNV